MDWKSLAMQLALASLNANPKTRALVPYVGPAIAAAEDLAHADGAKKLVHATDLVRMGISGTNAVRPGTVDQTITDALISHTVSSIVDATNLLHAAQASAPTV